MLKLIPALLLLSALCLSASPASADVAPPDCYEETCTLAVVTASGGDCSSCDNGPAVEDGCIEEMGSSKVKVCQTYGASAYTEIWCEPDSGFTTPPDPLASCEEGDDAGAGSDAGSDASGTTGDTSGTSGGTTDDGSGGGDDEDSGCHVSPAGSTGDGALMLLLAGLGAVVIRRFGRSA